MTIRSKARRRVAILLAAAVLLAAGAGGAYVFRKHQLKTRALDAKAQGFALFDKGDYPAAVDAFGQYLARFSKDNPDHKAALQYAQGLEKSDRVDGSNIIDAMNAYRFYLTLAPDDKDARRALLKLYVKAGFNAEAIDAAGALIDPKGAPDADALRSRALAYYRLRKLPDADADANAAILADPLNLDAQSVKLEIMRANGKTSEDVYDYTLALAQPDARLNPSSAKSPLRKELLFKTLAINPDAQAAAADKLVAELSAHKNDPRIGLLQASACAQIADGHRSANSPDKQKEWLDRARATLRAAAAQPMPNLATLERVVLALDTLECFPESLALAQQSAASHPREPDYARLALTRLFVTGNMAAVEEQTRSLKPDSDDPRLVAIRAMALARMGNAEQSAALADALDKRSPRDRVAVGMATLARDTWLPSKDDPADRVDRARKLIILDQANPFLYYYFAEALLAAGDTQQVSESFNNAIKCAPAWSLPMQRQARLLLEVGGAKDALEAARRAQLRAPNDREPAILFALATGDALAPNDKPGAQKALALCESTEQKFPNSPELLPLRVRLLAALDRKPAAIALLDAALAANPPLPASILSGLARVSQYAKLDYESRFYDLSEKAHGLTADLAYDRAVALASAGKLPDALAYLEAGVKAHPESAWRLIYARFLDYDYLQDKSSADKKALALKAWTALGNDFPADLAVLRTMLASSVVQSDHDLTSKTIDNLRAKVGADTAEIKLARAQFLLRPAADGKAPPEADVVEAATLLSDVTRLSPRQVLPHALLADLMSRRLSNPSGAIEQLRIAISLQEDAGKTPDVGYRITLANLLGLQGQTSAAANELKKIDPASLTPAQVPYYTQVALVVFDSKTAETVLSGITSPQATFDLFRLKVANGEFETADSLCSQVLKDPTANTIEVIARYHLARKRPAQAETTIKLLDALDVPEGVKNMARANYAADAGDLNKALDLYAAAGRALNGNPAPWIALLSTCYANNRSADALKFLPEAADSIRKSNNDQFLKDGAGILALASVQDELRTIGEAGATLVRAILDSTTDVSPLVEGIRIINNAAASKKSFAEVVPDFQRLAAANPKVPALQLYLIHLLLLTGQYDEAFALANTASAAFPGNPYAAEVACEAALKVNRTPDAIAAARAWRSRLGRASYPADVVLARLLLSVGQFDEGLSLLQSHAQAAQKNPGASRDFLTLYCQLLAARGLIDDAQAILEPHLSELPWRNSWLAVADCIQPVSAATAAAWLDRAEQKVPADQPVERVAIAPHWVNLAHKSSPDLARTCYTRARALFDAYLALPTADPGALFFAGMFYEEVGDPAVAETTYRRILQNPSADPKIKASTSNNLAMLVARKPGSPDLDQAEKLAVDATTLAADPNFFDSLATIRVLRKDFPNALAAIDKAIALQPKNPDWRATRLWILLAAGDKAQAAQTYKDLQAFDLKSLSPDSKKRVEDYRKTL